MSNIGVPTRSSFGKAFGLFGQGVVGGVALGLARTFLGSGILGSLVAPILAASVVRGSAGEILSVSAGYEAGPELVAQLLGQVSGGDGSGNEGDI